MKASSKLILNFHFFLIPSFFIRLESSWSSNNASESIHTNKCNIAEDIEQENVQVPQLYFFIPGHIRRKNFCLVFKRNNVTPEQDFLISAGL